MIGRLLTFYGSDKNTYHSYGSVYEAVLGPVRESVRAVLEIGIAGGASLKAWRDYFPNATVTGLDLSSDLVNEPRIESFRCDSRDPALVAAVLGDRRFDVIIDDGDHHPDAQNATRTAVWSFLRPGGTYVIEDVQWVESLADFVAQGATPYDLRAERPGVWDNMLAVFNKPPEAP